MKTMIALLICMSMLCGCENNDRLNELQAKYDALVKTVNPSLCKPIKHIVTDTSAASSDKHYWFTNNTFILRNVVFGKFNTHMFATDKYIPEQVFPELNIHTNESLAMTSRSICKDTEYLRFDIFGNTYIIAVGNPGWTRNWDVIGYKCKMIPIDRQLSLFCSDSFFWFSDFSKHDVFVSKHHISLDHNAYIRIYKMSDNRLAVKFFIEKNDSKLVAKNN